MERKENRFEEKMKIIGHQKQKVQFQMLFCSPLPSPSGTKITYVSKYYSLNECLHGGRLYREHRI